MAQQFNMIPNNFTHGLAPQQPGLGDSQSFNPQGMQMQGMQNPSQWLQRQVQQGQQQQQMRQQQMLNGGHPMNGMNGMQNPSMMNNNQVRSSTPFPLALSSRPIRYRPAPPGVSNSVSLDKWYLPPGILRL